MVPLASVEVLLFFIGTGVAAFVTGLTGFAFGMVAAALWLHALPPTHTTPLIVAYALLVQGYAVWKLRRAIRPGRVAPFIAGTAVGVPGGAFVLEWASSGELRAAVGVLLIAFSLYALTRPAVPVIRKSGAWLDGAIGLFNGVIGASTGLGGVLPNVWCGMRGWAAEEQRAVFQPTAVATFLLTLLWLGGTSSVEADTVRLFLLGLPVLMLGTWLGWAAYGRLDEARLRRVVLYVLLVAGLALVFGSIG
jgi:uncharacterized membrane protein YfcA